MIPAGYMAKWPYKRPDWLKAPQVAEIYSVSNCISKSFADYVPYWKHNGDWLFDSPEVIKTVAQQGSIQLAGTSLFYYEAHEMELDGERWIRGSPEASFPTNVVPTSSKKLEGFDVVTYYSRSTPECSPLSCNSMAEEVQTNAHCLFDSFDEAEKNLNDGTFKDAEPGPYRIFSIDSVDWP
jgi:hypothetical protein